MMHLADWLADPIRVVVLVALAIVLRIVIHRLIDKFTAGIARGTASIERRATSVALGKNQAPPEESGDGGLSLDQLRHQTRPSSTAVTPSQLLLSRAELRAKTTASVLKSLATAIIAIITIVTIMDLFKIPIGPLLAGAGIAGVAFGFGAQSLVKDVISGLFLLMEDQYGVSDNVDVGTATGTVEAVGLRVTRLRAVDGSLWYIRNGEIARVRNQSQGWAQATIDVMVKHGENLQRAQELLREITKDLYEDPQFESVVLDSPTILAMNSITAEGITTRVTITTIPGQNFAVERELRGRIVERFRVENIKMTYPPLLPPATATPSV